MDPNAEALAGWADSHLKNSTKTVAKAAKGGGGGGDQGGGQPSGAEGGDEGASHELSAKLQDASAGIDEALNDIEQCLTQDAGMNENAILPKPLAKKIDKAHGKLADALEEFAGLMEDIKKAEEDHEEEEGDEEPDGDEDEDTQEDAGGGGDQGGGGDGGGESGGGGEGG